MAIEEDFSIFTDLNGFGTTAAIGLSGSVNGIFTTEYVETNFGNTPVSGEHPIFGCAVADLPQYTYGTEITINGTPYKIRNWQPDGTGWITLILEQQS